MMVTQLVQFSRVWLDRKPVHTVA